MDIDYNEIINSVDREVSEILSKEIGVWGYDNEFDRIKKQILKEKYNIEWKTRQENIKGCSID